MEQRRWACVGAVVAALFLALWSMSSLPAPVREVDSAPRRSLGTGGASRSLLADSSVTPGAAAQVAAAKAAALSGLRIVDDAGIAVGAAAVLVNGAEHVADPHGFVAVDPGVHAVHVSGTELYQSTDERVVVSADEVCDIFVARRRGWLQVNVVDAAGDPLAGVRVVLLPPFDGAPLTGMWPREFTELTTVEERFEQELFDEFFGRRVLLHDLEEYAQTELSAVSGEDGVVDFRHLPTGWGYRFGVDSDQLMVLELPHENDGAETIVLPSGVLELQPAAAAPRGLSGEFFVGEGQGLVLEAQLFTGSLAYGKLDLMPGSLEWGRVLIQELRHVDRNGDGTVDCETPRTVGSFEPPPVWDGSFRFEDVPVHCWLRLRASYRIDKDDGQHCYFATATTFATTAETDFGIVPTLPGRDPEASTLAGRVTLRENGQEVGPVVAFVDPPTTALVQVFDEWFREEVGNGVVGGVRVLLGVPFVLHGLSGTRVRVQAAPDLDWYSRHKVEGVEVRAPKKQRIDRLPASEEFAFDVLRMQETPLVFHYPRHEPFWGIAFLRHSESGRVVEIPLPRPDAPTAYNITVSRVLERGEWQLLAHTNSPFDPKGAENWVAERSFSVPAEGEVDVHFEAGAVLLVRALRNDGDRAPFADDGVSLTPVSWLGSHGPVWTYDAPTGSDGVAKFVGLPPGAEVFTHLDESKRFAATRGEVEIVSVDW